MRKITFLLFLLATVTTNAFATWSVIAVDRKTGQVVIASATCVPQKAFSGFPAKGLKDVQAIIVPGVGVAAAQANVDRTRLLQRLIADELNRGTDPARIIDMLKAQDANHPSRQYGIVDLKGRAAGYSGGGNGKQALDRQGRVERADIYFSIQGNILTGDDVVEDAVTAFNKTKGSLADRVMAAMEAADSRGGDRRCNCNTKPDPPAQCDNKAAHVAYLVVANKSDKMGEGLNDGSYYLEIQVTDQDIQPNENDNPVKTLRTRYDRWIKDHARRGRSK
ncbi:MAG TPA: DUF1028 domain-containing protein [Blastocatellia bacterium]|nr:DUF1028 domain-containing protein [Blastocatellia bacterium]